MTPTEKLLKALRAHAENAKPGETKSRLGLLKLAEDAIKYERTPKDVQTFDPAMYEPAVDDFGNQYLFRLFPARDDTGDEVDYMCPNCVTPWKCNGPHLTV